MNLQVVRPIPSLALAAPFRLTLTRVSPIAEAKSCMSLEKDAHRRLGPPNWRGAGKEQGK